MESWKKVFAIIWTGKLLSTMSNAIVGYAVVFWLSMETRSAEVLAFATIDTSFMEVSRFYRQCLVYCRPVSLPMPLAFQMPL